MIQRYEIYRPYHFCDPKCDPINADDSGEFVLYADHLAAIAEKDKEIERLRKDLENKNFLAARMYQFTKNGGQRWLKNRSMSR